MLSILAFQLFLHSMTTSRNLCYFLTQYNIVLKWLEQYLVNGNWFLLSQYNMRSCFFNVNVTEIYAAELHRLSDLIQTRCQFLIERNFWCLNWSLLPDGYPSFVLIRFQFVACSYPIACVVVDFFTIGESGFHSYGCIHYMCTTHLSNQQNILYTMS